MDERERRSNISHGLSSSAKSWWMETTCAPQRDSSTMVFLLLLICALLSGCVFFGVQSFILLPQLYPRSSSCEWNEKYSSTTALFVRDSGEWRNKTTSRNHTHHRPTNQNPAYAINKRLIELSEKKQWRQLLEVAELEQASFNNVNYATVMSQLGRIGYFNKADPRFVTFMQALATMIEDRGLPWFKPREASNIIHAIGKMQLRNPCTKSILQWISKSEVAASFVEIGNPHDISNVAWAFAKLEIESPNLFAEIEHRSKWLVETGNPQAVTNTAWACATLGYEAPNLFAEIEHRSKWLVDEGTPQGVANTAWACATLGFKAPNLFAEIERQSKWLVEKGTPQNVANVALACAKLGVKAPNLFAEIEHRSKWLVEEGEPQAAANTAWACATLGVEAPNLFAEIEHRSKWLVDEGNPQAVANTAWACATLGVEAPELFAEIERQSKWLVQAGNPQNVVNTAWACATLGFEAPGLFAEIEHQSRWLFEEGNPQNVGNMAWACAKLGMEAPNLFAEIDLHTDRLMENAKPQEISNTCYAIAVLGKSQNFESLLAKLWEKSIELFASDADFIDETLRQLAQTQIFAEADGIMLPQIPEPMAKKMELVRNTVDESFSRSSKQVSQLLHEIGFHHECEVFPDSTLSSGILAIDFACLEQKVALEFDGPSHYLKAVGSGKITSTEKGATKAKRRYLEQLGWTVINIDYRDYMLAQHASNEKQWLRKLLHASSVPLSNQHIPKPKTDSVAGPQKELNVQQKKEGFLSEPAINSRILFKSVVKKNSVRFEAALVKELTERGITSIPMAKSGKPDFIKMKAALKAWALEKDNDPKAKQDETYRASFIPKCLALWTSIFEELQGQSEK